MYAYVQDAGGIVPTADAPLAAGATLSKGAYSTVDYRFNASVPAQMQGFIKILQEVSCKLWGMHMGSVAL